MTELHKHKTGFGLTLKKGDVLDLSNKPSALNQIFFGYSGESNNKKQVSDKNDEVKK